MTHPSQPPTNKNEPCTDPARDHWDNFDSDDGTTPDAGAKKRDWPDRTDLVDLVRREYGVGYAEASQMLDNCERPYYAAMDADVSAPSTPTPNGFQDGLREIIAESFGLVQKYGSWFYPTVLRDVDFEDEVGEQFTSADDALDKTTAAITAAVLRRLPERVQREPQTMFGKGWNACLDQTEATIKGQHPQEDGK